MNDKTRSELVKFRVQRCNETMLEVVELHSKGLNFGTINRCYYAAFYAAIALLAKEKFSAKTHKGVSMIIQQEFVATGRLEKRIGIYYNELLQYRERGDYVDFMVYSTPDADTTYAKTKEVVSAILVVINSSNN